MEPRDIQPTPKPSRSYGARPLWKVVLIYLAVATIVYGLIYYFFIAETGATPTI